MATVAEVLEGRGSWAVEAADALAFLRSLPDRSCSLVFFSPPYEDARTYGIGFREKRGGWADWLRPIVVEAARVSAGLVGVNVGGVVRDFRYSAAPEFLVADLVRLDGLVCGPSPYAWVRNGIPGSGGKHYHRRDWEPVYCLALPDRLPLVWSDNTAFGHPPKYGPGGGIGNRLPDGTRVNDQWKKRGRGNGLGGRRRNGTRKMPATMSPRTVADGEPPIQLYDAPKVANPGNVVKTRNGGGALGHKLAHHNEAPMNLGLAERFVCWYAPPGSVVCDPFAGSGTTAHAAIVHGRRFVGCDVRESQVRLTERRLRTVTPNLIVEGAGGPHPGGDHADG